MAGGRSQRHLREQHGIDSAGDCYFPGPCPPGTNMGLATPEPPTPPRAPVVTPDPEPTPDECDDDA